MLRGPQNADIRAGPKDNLAVGPGAIGLFVNPGASPIVLR